MARIKVGVLRGGPSNEFDVSLKSGAAVLEHLDDEKYQPIDIFVDKGGHWHLQGFPVSEANALRQTDIVINALHGGYGEDGTVQRVLDAVGVPYTGSGSIASALAFNKGMTKRALRGDTILLAPHLVIERADDLERQMLEIFRTFPQPSVMKPLSGGSSVGVSLAHSLDELIEGAERAFAHSPKILIEEYIKGREATVGVVEDFRDEDLYALLPTEIVPPPHKQFFDYDAKYSGESQELCPGNFSQSEKEELQRLAKLVHKKLGLRHYSRSDFIVSPRGIYFLEVNTLPGMTNESLLPKGLHAVGSSLRQFLDHLIQLVLKKKAS